MRRPMAVARFAVRRLLQGLVVLWVITVVTFLLVNVAPGGPGAVLRMETTAEQREALIRQLGLDQPLPARYARWLGGALRGDFGLSMNSREPVMPLVLERLGNTAVLAAATLVLSLAVGLALGVAAALRRGTWIDHAATLISTLGVSVPDFWFGILLIMALSVQWNLLPSGGMATVGAGFSLADRLQHLVMPAFVLMLVILPNILRFVRSSLLEVLHQDFIRTARAKGAGPARVVLVHALRNALIPVLTMLGLLIPALLGGSVIAESVFAWPGMGRLAVEAAMGRDYPVIMAVTVVAGVVVVVTNLVVDLAYSLVDPRIRHTAA
ncbi:binding-protein-dependent transport systems inner membrane component [Thermaerobacter marianensis DSM 12885]|uniref:Binding-protein-dependent transport systems inner membrane component n=1 Tax=Thermaerobacter marianensis (strain ATCC 700841 / DSM 12885 / JCM 10246 / 7p75a) TaxID=644966 RepID=E6SHV4_THEM7|nr:ABC transporter permease [Thermaerobacter marianensis]ADU50801.1 binding-protein-dependent transport systems inner membrane component [Thermaerobacter marianensis DSM 12885]